MRRNFRTVIAIMMSILLVFPAFGNMAYAKTKSKSSSKSNVVYAHFYHKDVAAKDPNLATLETYMDPIYLALENNQWDKLNTYCLNFYNNYTTVYPMMIPYLEHAGTSQTDIKKGKAWFLLPTSSGNTVSVETWVEDDNYFNIKLVVVNASTDKMPCTDKENEYVEYGVNKFDSGDRFAEWGYAKKVLGTGITAYGIDEVYDGVWDYEPQNSDIEPSDIGYMVEW